MSTPWLALLIASFGMLCYGIGRIDGARWEREQRNKRLR